MIDSRKWPILGPVCTTSGFQRMLRGASLRVTAPRLAVLRAVRDPHVPIPPVFVASSEQESRYLIHCTP